MAENPLLPNAELRALHKLLKLASSIVAVLEKKAKASAAQTQEALLAGTLLQLRTGDSLVSEPDTSSILSALVERDEKKLGARPSMPVFSKGAPRLLYAAGLAAAAQRASQENLVLAFTRSGTQEPFWADTVKWAQEALLPLVLVCVDASGSDVFRNAPAKEPDVLDWGSFQRTAARVKLPILSVDGQDAVAVYRVMQESALRARAGGGPAVLWAVLPSAREARASRKGAMSPLARLEHFLTTRKVSLP